MPDKLDKTFAIRVSEVIWHKLNALPWSEKKKLIKELRAKAEEAVAPK